MSLPLIISVLTQHALRQPQLTALSNAHTRLSYAELNQVVQQSSDWLRQQQVKVMALAMDNTPAWVVWDLAALAAGVTHVPIPGFFSPLQKQHALRDAGVELLLTDQPAHWLALLDGATQLGQYHVAGVEVSVLQLPLKLPINAHPHLHRAPASAQRNGSDHIAKITYTSGTTGQPKGVCLSEESMTQVATSILAALKLPANHRHFCVLPLATLLENVSGVYATLLAGGHVVVLPLAEAGFQGSRFDIARLHQGLLSSRAHTAIVLPELLRALVLALQQGLPLLKDLYFLAVGGAKVAPALLAEAADCHLPVYEGYGLSECASVVTLNLPQANRPGSIGKPLPHMQLKLAADGELWVRGNTFLGYTRPGHALQIADTDELGYMPSGDLAKVDADGYWYLIGRKKNMFVTSFGRNVSPEWVESSLCHGPLILQACVFGEARPFNVAVIVAATEASPSQITHAIQACNADLPDYARIHRWTLATQPFTLHNGQLTANGRVKREAIWQVYQSTLDALYTEHL